MPSSLEASVIDRADRAVIHRASRAPSECFTSDIVTIDVGPPHDKQTFSVHTDLLCYYSGYFKAALRGRFIEARTKHIDLPSNEIDVFTAFVHWIYTRILPGPDEDAAIATLSQLWVFGDQRQIPLLQNEAIDQIARAASKQGHIPKAFVPYVYCYTTCNSPLRRLAIDLVCKGCPRGLSDFFEKWDKQMLIDLAEAHMSDPRVGLIAGQRVRHMDYYVEDQGQDPAGVSEDRSN
ncbi:unnamed protein product [Zymoseptoria tritici ST99CH_1E4]|uniref:BTB domain-containing protein n=1 Tax=Zymoseptoria tritici ST99CH_1E4 TaxID=1276532 RepID=A0A2H1H9M8_ZYMTR|nr:unnamed protein product [Zymoseptoria tritici ST99CH_1E4]